MSLELRETKVNNALVWALVRKTGLTFRTVRNLLVNGWTYQEVDKEPPRWISPMARLKELNRG